MSTELTDWDQHHLNRQMEDLQQRLGALEEGLQQAQQAQAEAALQIGLDADDGGMDEAQEHMAAQDGLIQQLQNQLNILRERTEPTPIKTPANTILPFHGRTDEDLNHGGSFLSWPPIAKGL